MHQNETPLSPLMITGGFSLVEVVVGLLVFEVGFLGVLAMTLQAQRMLHAATVLESASWTVDWLADSLSFADWGGAGDLQIDQGSLEWDAGPGGFVTITFDGGPGARRSFSLIPGEWDGP